MPVSNTTAAKTAPAGASLVSCARAAELAQRRWERTPPARRRAALDGLRARVVSGHDALCQVQSRATGETLVDVAVGDLEPLLALLSALPAAVARNTSSGGWPRLWRAPRVRRSPVGVVGLAYTRPARLLDVLAPLATALYAGNAVVLATSEPSDPVLERGVGLVRERLAVVGADPALVAWRAGQEAPQVALESAGLDLVWESANAPLGVAMAVSAGADLAVAESRALAGAFASAGRARLPIRRVYADRAVHAALTTRLVDAAAALRLGPADGPEVVDCGSALSADLEQVDALLGDAVARGARILVGGEHVESLGARFYQPTLVVDVDSSMRIAREPFEGPVLCLMRPGLRPPAGRTATLEVDARGVRIRVAGPEHIGWAFGALALPEALRACTRGHVELADPSCPPRRRYPVGPNSYPMMRELAGLWHGGGARARLGHALGAARLFASEHLLG